MPLDPHDFKRLRNQISRGEVILFTGAGFSRDAADHDGQPIPSPRELAERLFSLLYTGQDFEDGTSLGELYAVAVKRDPHAVTALLARHLCVDPNSLPEYYRTYFSFPWRRVYTLNVDDLEEAVARRFTLPRRALPLSALTSGDEGIQQHGPDTRLDVVHLNGRATDSLDSMTFSEGQYGERLANREPWYVRCATDIRTRPVLFVGTTLNESLLWQHVALRRREQPRAAYVPPPASILITPHLTKVRAEMLRDLNVSWFEGTAESFEREVLSQLLEEAQRGIAFLGVYSDVHGRRGVQLVSDLASESPKLSTEYLLGDEPIWADLVQGRAVIRSGFEELKSKAVDILKEPSSNTVLAVTGTAGTGKSTALMWLSLELSNRGLPVIWLDKDATAVPRHIIQRVDDTDGKVVLAVDDADMYSGLLDGVFRDLARRADVLCIIAVRSGKLNNVAAPLTQSREISISEFVVPGLTDEDIDGLIEVLDRHHRLGKLKGVSDTARRRAFSDKAGRQLLVAMIEATLDVRFEEKAVTEADDLTGVEWFLYALMVLVTSQRYYLTKQEALMACPGSVNDAAAALFNLVRRHLVTVTPPHQPYRVRHRVIAEVVLSHLQTKRQLKDVFVGLTCAIATEIDPTVEIRSRPWRMIGRFINHKLLLNLLGVSDAREVYESVEELLSFDYHYWLQRGSLEVEGGDLRSAEQFLNQARSLSMDLRVQTEYGYLLLKKAVHNPVDVHAEVWFDEGTQLLEAVMNRSRSGVYPFHILGSQGLAWVRRRATTPEDKRRMLAVYINVVEDGLKKHPVSRDLRQLQQDLQRESLLTIVPGPD